MKKLLLICLCAIYCTMPPPTPPTQKKITAFVAWEQSGEAYEWDIWSRGTVPKTEWRLLATVKDTGRFIVFFDSGEHRIDITAWLKGVESKSSDQVRFNVPFSNDVKFVVTDINTVSNSDTLFSNDFILQDVVIETRATWGVNQDKVLGGKVLKVSKGTDGFISFAVVNCSKLKLIVMDGANDTEPVRIIWAPNNQTIELDLNDDIPVAVELNIGNYTGEIIIHADMRNIKENFRLNYIVAESL